MPNRILREGILTSERINSLAWPEEVFYRRLMSVVDDYGRYQAHHSLLRAALYPLRLDKVSDSDVGKWLLATEKAGLVRVYPASDGKRYLELMDFRQSVRAKESKYPAFDEQTKPMRAADATHVRSKCDADAPVFEDEDVDECGGVFDAQARKHRPSRRCPHDFEVTSEMRAWAATEAPTVDIDFETKAMRDHEFEKPKTDWPATWRNWMRTAYRRQPRRNSPATASTRQDRISATVAGLTGRPRQQPEVIDVVVTERVS